MSRKITFLTLFLWLMTVTFPVIAQQKADTTYTFRFVPQKDMFLWASTKETVSSRQRKALFYLGGSTIRVSATAL